MFTNLNVFRMAEAMAVHAGQRQAVIAQNVANADTPGYQAQDLTPFADSYQNQNSGGFMRATRANHLNAGSSGGNEMAGVKMNLATDPNDNSVSIEQEMLKAVDVKRQHDRAIAIYKSSLSILRASIGRG
ncbi:MAG: flagellar basal-body rod protein FlgB [Paracoccaceae bacterium]|jgi:flagellar basal-body rod protein FlgB